MNRASKLATGPSLTGTTDEPSTTRPALSSPHQRDVVFDFTKGVLVEVMVVFHSIQYFVNLRHPSLNYLAFVTGAFVLMSGMVATQIYHQKYRNQRDVIAKRLLIRGVKLLLLFSVLNVLYYSLGIGEKVLAFDHTVKQLRQIYITGNKQLVVFTILLPIAYTLIIAALLGLAPCFHYLAGFLCVAGLTCLQWESADLYNLQFVTIGILGIVIGFYRATRTANERSVRGEVMVYVGVVLYLISVALIPVDTPLLYMAGVFVVVESFMLIGKRLIPDMVVVRVICKLGQYSLLGYIVQIAFLQMLRKVFGTAVLGSAWGLGAIVLCNVMLVCLVYLTELFRARLAFVDRTYRIVFA